MFPFQSDSSVTSNSGSAWEAGFRVFTFFTCEPCETSGVSTCQPAFPVYYFFTCETCKACEPCETGEASETRRIRLTNPPSLYMLGSLVKPAKQVEPAKVRPARSDLPTRFHCLSFLHLENRRTHPQVTTDEPASPTFTGVVISGSERDPRT